MKAQVSSSAGVRGHVSPAAGSAPTRTYQPLTWIRPSTGQVLAASASALGKAWLTIIVGTAVLVGAGIVIALVLTTILGVLGLDAADSYS
ncbi:hypothetical protein [Actinoplanes palleronii]|uniref:Uncharacterized protein n=1 Tax=Actinoplanes palleronii TaxID=113570 RepID=A0ABQ4B9R3_9ACTN|nr:hypothetical protein [Actinoplanes palleronii]GIE67447.1 hypothetical protein Apa02nite_035550 [Actinoplanes palleronii]